MVELRNLAWHRKAVALILNYQDGTPDQDFTGPSNDQWEKIDAGINEALVEERNLAVLHGSSEAFKRAQRFTWSTGAVTFPMPSFIDRESVVSIHDVTNDSVGIPIYVSPRWANHKIFFLDAHTLQWATTGPGQNTTLEVSYIAEPPVLKDPADEADLFPYNHRHLINWSAACVIIDTSDQRVPESWLRRRDSYRSSLHLAVSRGSPSEYGVPRIRNHRAARFR